MKKLIVILCSFLAIHSVALADPNPAQAQKNLKQFLGSWTGKNVSIETGGQKIHTEYHADFKAAADGTGIMMHEWFTAEGMGQYIGENIVGYDPNTGLIHWYSIDNTGTCHDHYGYWINNKHLFVQHQGVVDGKMYVEQLDMEFISATEMHITVTGMLNGTVTEKIDGTFKKMQ
jgi:hypothetical protein